MNLSKDSLNRINISSGAELPGTAYFDLPEKVLQFGTGVLLRGLPDYFIDKANKQGIFNGRIVVVKSTAGGGTDAFDKQDGLYTLCVRGVEAGKIIEENIINASISRVLSASSQWKEILRCASNPQMQVIISNTTEVGLTLKQDDDITAFPPESFPGKLLSFLYERYRVFNGAEDKGMVIIPTELIPDNGLLLESIVEELAHLNNMEYAFLDWLENCNYFCSSLVDRIVPGKMSAERQKEVEQLLGFQDELMIMSEVYRLWAIESQQKKVRQILSFGEADSGVVIAGDISNFRELKLRILNGSHSFSCGLAILAGLDTVKNAMDNKQLCDYISNLMFGEIIPALAGDNLPAETAKEFSTSVLDRYRNPFLEHHWLNISMQYSSKMAMRNVPLIAKYYERFGSVPELMALGFAGHILFMKCTKDEEGRYEGEINGKKYRINDDKAGHYHKAWQKKEVRKTVHDILNSEALWDSDLTAWPGFEASVLKKLEQLQNENVLDVIRKLKFSGVAM